METSLRHSPAWAALRQASSALSRPVLASGHAALDAALHEGGWPLGALTELLTPLPGLAELWLLAPALRQALRQPGWLLLVTPPGLPHAPAWQALGLPAERLLIVRPDNPRDWLWSVDQGARSGSCAVLAWPGRVGLKGKTLRRLQLAAEAGGGLLVLARRPAAQEDASPAALRLGLEPQGAQLGIQVLKQRGSWGGHELSLALPFPEQMPPPAESWQPEPPGPAASLRPQLRVVA